MQKSQSTLRIISLSVLMLVLTACSLPNIDHRIESRALTLAEAEATSLGQSIQKQTAANLGLSGIHTLSNPRDAFAARALLARVAERSLDVQYYIWKNDITGTLLLEELHAAADRGVKVRLLLDDNGTWGLDEDLSLLNLHPNIQIRLFNPFLSRRFKLMGYLTDFDRLNRRMHNKSFTADNSVTIVGGRNIGDEYFGATDGVLFADLDVMAIGPVVDSVSQDFDHYWASLSSYPLELIVSRKDDAPFSGYHNQAKAVENLPGAFEYVQAIRELHFVKNLINNELPLLWANTRMISDDPNKGLGLAKKEDLLITRLSEMGGQAKNELLLVSPYFVPTKEGTKAFTDLANSNIRVTVLTNSLAATDVVPVHAGYAKRRKELLKNDIKLFEMRRTAPKTDVEFYKIFGSSGSSLHAKTFAIDRERVFVGSFNFDPRSANLNTELGFLIESEELANSIVDIFENKIYNHAYAVTLNKSGNLEWREQVGDTSITYQKEPSTSWFKRAFVTFCSWLPIEPLL